ncbi:hypothetical protein [Escherichia coli]|nr:hypothetical protein [Escherichia coli]WHG41229.1 hypothetical protein QDY29_21265 [Escherichia coli]WHH03216.1 hypothetical protein QDW91_23025 [Escherichia coli]
MANFSVAARTLIHLGAELITSDEVAINELVKNAFDAESKRVRINVFIPISHSLIDDCLAILDNSKKEEALQDDIFHIKKMLIESVSEPSIAAQVEELLLNLTSDSSKDEAKK